MGQGGVRSTTLSVVAIGWGATLEKRGGRGWAEPLSPHDRAWRVEFINLHGWEQGNFYFLLQSMKDVLLKNGSKIDLYYRFSCAMPSMNASMSPRLKQVG